MVGNSLLSYMITLTTRNIDCPDFKYDQGFRCKMSPDGLKVAVSQIWGLSHWTYILGITSGSSVHITDLTGASDVTWFPDSKRIAYTRSWQCGHGLCYRCCDLVVQCLASGRITTIHRWYNDMHSDVFVTPDGSRVITRSFLLYGPFWTWDVSDL